MHIITIEIENGLESNAISGKAQRINMQKRKTPISKLGDPRKNQKKNEEQNNMDLPLKIILRDVEWSRNSCCWPIGAPKLPGFSFCGASINPGRPYCAEHSSLAYTNTRES